jgi:DNA-binding transcriptional ArsR family regulator
MLRPQVVGTRGDIAMPISIKELQRRESDVCDVSYVDQGRVRRVARVMPSPEAVERLSETFRIVGDPTRTKMLFALSREELCVCDLAHLLGLSESAASHQLRLLRAMRLVKYRKAGKMAYYSLDDEHIADLIKQGLRHVEE